MGYFRIYANSVIIDVGKLGCKNVLFYILRQQEFFRCSYIICLRQLDWPIIFENGPGGTINTRSSGFKYLKTIIALMMQIMVITVICQVYPNITIAVNAGYFADAGDDELQKQQEEQKIKF